MFKPVSYLYFTLCLAWDLICYLLLLEVSSLLVTSFCSPICLRNHLQQIVSYYVSEDILYFQVDPYLGISDDFQVYVKPWADVREFGSAADNKDAASLLHDLRNQVYETDKIVVDSLVQSLSGITEVRFVIVNHGLYSYVTSYYLSLSYLRVLYECVLYVVSHLCFLFCLLSWSQMT